MSGFAKLGDDASVACNGCDASWSVEFLVVDIGRADLRYHGFSFLWFDDGMIGVNSCPHCELPLFSRETFSCLSQHLVPI